MLPVLLKLLHMPTVLEQVPAVLTALLQRSPAMQKAAKDSDAVSSLTTILHHDHTWHNRPRFKASTTQQRPPALLVLNLRDGSQPLRQPWCRPQSYPA